MASLRDVKQKIVGIKKTKQITKAMYMVSSAKLRGAQSRIERFRPYADKFYDMLADLASKAEESAHPLLETRAEIKTVAIVLVTSDRGLCGSFNTNLINISMKLAKEKTAEGKQVKFICVGKKGRNVFRKSGYELASSHIDKMGAFDFTLANTVGMEIINGYLNGEFDEVVLAYGQFISMAKQLPVVRRVLPIAAEEAAEKPAEGMSSEYIYEPAVEGLLAELLPRFIKVQVYRSMLDTSASEHAARMSAMDNATRACDDMADAMTLVYNKTRQATITKELMDIVGGAEALKG
jgi:F-type H+-transporting ATPase subunit gamma